MRAVSLKGKRVETLIERWIEEGTLKNRMARLRWWAEKVKRGGIPADSMEFGIPDRRYVTDISRARDLGAPLEEICDPYVRKSLKL